MDILGISLSVFVVAIFFRLGLFYWKGINGWRQYLFTKLELTREKLTDEVITWKELKYNSVVVLHNWLIGLGIFAVGLAGFKNFYTLPSYLDYYVPLMLMGFGSGIIDNDVPKLFNRIKQVLPILEEAERIAEEDFLPKEEATTEEATAETEGEEWEQKEMTNEETNEETQQQEQ